MIHIRVENGEVVHVESDQQGGVVLENGFHYAVEYYDTAANEAELSDLELAAPTEEVVAQTPAEPEVPELVENKEDFDHSQPESQAIEPEAGEQQSELTTNQQGTPVWTEVPPTQVDNVFVDEDK